MKTNIIKLMMSLAIMVSFMTSCVDVPDTNNNGGIDNPNSSFNFATTKVITLNVTYDVESDYSVLFKVYAENPFERVDGQIELNKNINPIAAGFTDAGGRYSEQIVIPSTTNDIYVYSYYIGVPHLLKVPLNGDAVFLTADNEIDPAEELPATQSRSFATPVTYKSYSSWNKYGRINESDRIEIDRLSTSKINTINRNLPENGDNSKFALAADFYISEDATVKIRYIDGATSARSTFGYYCYKGNVAPSNPAALTKIIIFPNANKFSNGIAQNDAVDLKFYDEAKGAFTNVFPKGYTLGFFVVNEGGSLLSTTNKLIEGYGTFYSTPQYNQDRRTHTAAFDLTQNKSTVRVLSFEDWYDNDYNDVMFSIHATPITALGPVPAVLTDNKEQITSITYKGIIAFEDLWPNQGDFDLNDVVVKYESQIFIGAKDNKVIKTEDIFTLLWSGASLQNGFGYIINTPRSNIESVTVESGYRFAGQGLEPDANEAIVMLIDKSMAALEQSNGAIPMHITTVFKNRLSISELGASPYNSFIVSNGSTEMNRKEIHLVDNKPSSKCDLSYFGTKDDISFPANNLYYRTKKNFPFAIQMLNIVDISVFLNRANEGIPINVKFPKYNNWVTSKGANDKDWYNFPAK